MGLKAEAARVNFIKLQKKCLSNTVQSKIIDGKNEERIITSPYGTITCPEVLIHDYVWETLQNYSKMVALVCNNIGIIIMILLDKFAIE
jgi:hypothetical protein